MEVRAGGRKGGVSTEARAGDRGRGGGGVGGVKGDIAHNLSLVNFIRY